MTQMPPSAEIPLPPLELANRVGRVDGYDKPWETLYDAIGQAIHRDLIAALPEGYSLEGRRVLDFGCGAGRSLRHFVQSGPAADYWGCDIDVESIAWLHEHLSPPLQVFANRELPPLEQPDSHFDVVFGVSVFTHLTRSWSAWLAELHRVLKPDGLLLATFIGEGFSEQIAGEEWEEDRVGMLTLRPGQGWEQGGPMVLHSPWWIREHWGRLFNVVSLSPYGFGGMGPDGGQGLAVLRRKEVRIDPAELEELSSDPREAIALAHNLDRLMGELEELRPAWQELDEARQGSAREIARLEADAVALSERLQATSAALLDANQRLAQLPLLASEAEARREESVWLVGERDGLEERIASLEDQLAAARQAASDG